MQQAIVNLFFVVADRHPNVVPSETDPLWLRNGITLLKTSHLSFYPPVTLIKKNTTTL